MSTKFRRRSFVSISSATLLMVSPLAFALPAQAQEITIALAEEPDTLDPCELTKRNVGYVIRENIVETVTEIDQSTGEVRPRLAEKWESVSDNTWRFTFRDNVTFHDGEPLNAEAFITAFSRMMSPTWQAVFEPNATRPAAGNDSV